MSELTNEVTRICTAYTGYMKFARLLKLVNLVARNYDLGKDTAAQEFVSHTLFLVYEMGMKEKIYGV
jgi:hypothetical protein